MFQTYEISKNLVFVWKYVWKYVKKKKESYNELPGTQKKKKKKKLGTVSEETAQLNSDRQK